MTSLEPQVGAQSDPKSHRDTGPFQAFIYTFTIHAEFISSHIIFLVCLFFRVPMPTSALISLWRLVPLYCPAEALETVSCRVIETTHILAASLPRGPYLARISSLVSFTSTQRLWSWVPQSPWPLEEDLETPLGHMLPSSRGLQWAARTLSGSLSGPTGVLVKVIELGPPEMLGGSFWNKH